MAANSISVAVRIRPLSSKEESLLVPTANLNNVPSFNGEGSVSVAAASSTSKNHGNLRRIVRAIDDRVLVLNPPEKTMLVNYQRSILGPKAKEKDLRFCFDRVYDETATQEDVFQGSARELLSGVLDGFNATVFAYGATGCGKTHTISGSATEPGIIFLLAKELFDRVAAKENETQSDITLSYLEIYNENIRDLLVPNSPANLGLRESDGRIVVPQLSEQSPTSAEEVVSVILAANANRSVSATEANAVSSRSHAVLCLNVRQKPRTASMQETYTMATLSIIDLAGSERASVTKNKGERLVEGANINRSLLALGNCINALCDVKKSASHVPYRDSKLTRLLKHSLGGNCRTLMLVCISAVHYDESFNTLQYANRAKEIKTKLSKNVVSVDRHVSQYVKVIYELRSELEAIKKTGGAAEKQWREDYQKEKNKAWADVQSSIIALGKHYDEARKAVEASASAQLELLALQAAESALQDWKAAVFIGNTVRDTTYSYPLERIADAFTNAQRVIASDLSSADSARSLFKKNSQSILRKYSNPLGQYVQQYPEMLRCITLEVQSKELELDLAARPSSTISNNHNSHAVSFHAALLEVQSKMRTDLSICNESQSDRKAQLEQLLQREQTATAQLATRLAQNTQQPAKVSTAPLVRKRNAGTRSPLLGSVAATDARPEKAQRSSLNLTAAPSVLQSSVRRSLNVANTAGNAAASTSGRSSLKASTLPPRSAVIKGQPSSKRGETKGVAWRDDAGEALTEEHSKSVIDYSDASASTHPDDTRAGSPEGKLKTSISESATREADELSLSAVHSDTSRQVLLDLGNESLASSTGDTSAESNSHSRASSSRAAESLRSSEVSANMGQVGSLPTSQTPGTPPKASRQVSGIGPIRSAKKNRRVSYIDPAIGDISLASARRVPIGDGLPIVPARKAARAGSSVHQSNSLGLPAIRKPAQTEARGINARIAAVRAGRDSTSAPRFAATSFLSAGKPLENSIEHGASTNCKPPVWR